MSNLADLKVGLLLNDVSFRTQIADAYRHAGSESERFSRKVSADNKKSEESFASLSKSINSVAGKLALISGTGLSLGAIINTTRQYSQSLSDLASITGATKEQMVLFDEAAQEMGRTTQFSAMQGAEAIKLMASAKPDLMKTSSGLIDVTKSALILAQASGTTLPDATRTLALSLNQFGVSVADTDRYINVLAAGAKYGSSEVNETSEAIKKSGVAAANAKMSFEELNAAIQTLAEREVKGADAGTALRNMILKLEASTDKTLKPSVVGLGGALENLGKKNYSTTALTKLFGLENVNTAMILSQNAKKVKELTQALTGTDTAYEQAKERTNNLNGDLLGLSSAFEGMAIKVGQMSSGPLRAGINTTTDAVNALAGNLNTVVDVAAYGLIPLLGGRLSKGLQDQTTAWYDIQKASRAASVQMRDTALKGIADANEQLKYLTLQGERLTDHDRKMKEFDMQTLNRGRERDKLARLEIEATNQKIKYTRELEVATNRLSYSQRALAGTSTALKGAYAAMGGPVGAIMLAGSALYYFHNKSIEARQSALSLKDAVVETTAELMKLSKVKISVQIDDIQDDIKNLTEQRAIAQRQLEGYSDTKISSLRNRSKGMLGFMYEDPDEAQKQKNSLLSQIEDFNKGLEIANERLKTRQAIISGKITGENKPPEPDGEGTTGTKELPPKGTSGAKQLNQYQQLRRQIEAEHAVSLEKISLSETETLRKLQESYKAGGMKQGEFERLKTLNAENHMKQRAELAEKYSPTRALIRNEQDANKELKSLLDARLLTDKEYHHAKMRLEQDSTKNRLSEQARGIALPNISILGEIDPVVQLKNQLEEQRALYEAFYQNGIVSKERYEQLMTAASTRSKEAQLQASKELYAAQGNWQRMQINLFESIEQRMGNSLTGMITGSKSFSESLQDISASLAQSIIQDLVRIAMQAMITNALTGLMGGFAGGAASGASVGASGSASGTGAMGMPTSWKGYSRGGYTGDKGVNEISGVVHGKEYVFDAWATKSIGVENLESIRRNGIERTVNNASFGASEFKAAGKRTGSNSIDNSQMNKIEIYQNIQVSGNGDQALLEAMQQAAKSGAKQGSDDAIARIQRDFQSNGNIRKTLGR
ncbi:phage tail tape measure protein [Providencia rettgeri]|uniref:phage tail tape measure protein n=2 Tax=Morganellaceae TaxID=1903414 RepID=UPI001B394497|nr:MULTISPECIES: phage tail tape measure protein [Providencia]MBQ0263451.1 phage tail tape measure protein [Providencia rettgeri]MBZ3683758.1 phage tail tape measure protein [Providencia rettgeri]MCB4853694.1 phage tail tape measure protein [Providencia rettgeri]MCD6314410.1 phage tail tape measure protein [Providencia rettgeri]MCS4542605.1 phage tail tape measure protein [Providencia rettgeri]